MEQLSINTIRFLAADTVQAANSGHPGLPLGMAPTAYTLFAKHLNHNPKDTGWINRDRFVLSAGHGSALLYSLLHLFDYGLSTDDLKSFRQADSLTPGHPEYKHTRGVEATTGPLGQGIANAVGMAMAETYLAAKFNTDAHKIIDHYTYAMCGDGCLMEGVAQEAVSLAGTLALNKLIVLYDSNNITIEGSTDISFTENTADKFKALNWNHILVTDGNDINDISNAIEQAKKSDKPTIIEIKTIIGYGAPNKQGKSSAHGEPLGQVEIDAAKENLNWPHSDKGNFYVPEEVKSHIATVLEGLNEKQLSWNKLFQEYKSANGELSNELESWLSLNTDKLQELLKDESLINYGKPIATRLSSEIVLNKVAELVPNLIGGSADLAPSTKSAMKDREWYSKENRTGSNLHFGIREHAMGSIANGMALHGGLRPYTAGFFVFSDYMKPSLRMSAIMGLNIINIFTHDSIGVGEDGPTHQPIEQLTALRSIPNFVDFRPCDMTETVMAWYAALTDKTSPYGLVLTRQNLPFLNETGEGALKGGYILLDSDKLDVILMASGSEVALAYEAHAILKEKGIGARVISMPSIALFERQSEEYKNSVMPKECRNRIAIEAGSGMSWYKYVGLDGKVISMDNFGESAPFNILFEKYGFSVQNIVDNVVNMLK